MADLDIDDLNRKLAILAAKYGFAAIAHNAFRPEPQVVFEAFSWDDGELLSHTMSYPPTELAPIGAVAIVSRFIEEARLKLASGEVPDSHRARLSALV